MKIRDRIRDFRRVKASELTPNPRNWRTHPQAQQDALRGILAEVGIADALLARELPDGTLRLVDGHLRGDTAPDTEWPVLVLDINDEEEAKLLGTLDPLAAMAEADQQKFGELLAEIETESEAVEAMLAELAEQEGIDLYAPGAEVERPPVDLGSVTYRVIVLVADETQQAGLIERLESEGFECLPLMS